MVEADLERAEERAELGEKYVSVTLFDCVLVVFPFDAKYIDVVVCCLCVSQDAEFRR